MLLLIDNYDSFTHNLARYFVELGQQVEIVRNDSISCQQIAKLAPQTLVFSPGPCTPNESGITLEAINQFRGQIPMLGVCLGHQAIAQVFGARIKQAQTIMHGKTSQILHANSPLFNAVSTPFTATRYHSLVVERESLCREFSITAWETDSELQDIMAIEHKSLPIMGVQFHPESLLTTVGHTILQNFLDISEFWRQNHRIPDIAFDFASSTDKLA